MNKTEKNIIMTIATNGLVEIVNMSSVDKRNLRHLTAQKLVSQGILTCRATTHCSFAYVYTFNNSRFMKDCGFKPVHTMIKPIELHSTL